MCTHKGGRKLQNRSVVLDFSGLVPALARAEPLMMYMNDAVHQKNKGGSAHPSYGIQGLIFANTCIDHRFHFCSGQLGGVRIFARFQSAYVL